MASRLPSRLAVATRAAWHTAGRAFQRRKPTKPRRVLIAHHLLLGDTLMLTPLVAKLREQFPSAEIVMTCPVAYASLYQKHPYGLIAQPYDPRDIATFRALARNPGFDLALVPADNRYSWLARALDAQWVVAFSGDTPAYKNWPIDEFRDYPDTPMAWGDLAATLIEGPEPSAYDPAAWPAPDSAPVTLPSQPYCVVHVGASSPLRHWEPERWRQLGDYLREIGLTVVWSTGKSEAHLLTAIGLRADEHAFAGTLSLAQLWKVLASAQLLVCPDTGIAHLGRVVGVPSVVLFGPGSSILFSGGRFWRNTASVSVGVPDFPCRDENLIFRRSVSWAAHCGRSTVQCDSPKCMQALDLDSVRAAMQKIRVVRS